MPGGVMDARELLTTAYDRFNARDIDGVLRLMQADVDWPNAWQGGRIRGHEGLRDYWTRQWAVLNPTVQPVRFRADGLGRVVVTVHQVVRDQSGNVVSDSLVEHVYQLENGLIRRMDVGTA
jgi:hypothetical protein